MRAWLAMRCRAAAAALLALAVSCGGVLAAPDIRPAIAALEQRLLSTPNPSINQKLASEARRVLAAYVARDFPRQADAALESAFIANLSARFSALSDAQIGQWATWAAGNVDISGEFRFQFNSVAFFTVAGDALLRGPLNLDAPDWQRLPDGRPRRSDRPPPGWNNADAQWRDVEQRFEALSGAFRRESDHLTLGFYGDPANASASDAVQAVAAAQTREVWVGRLHRRLVRQFGSQGIQVDPDFLRDMAQLQYLMIGFRGENGGLVRPGLELLQGLSDAIGPSDEDSLVEVLRRQEAARGFRPDALVAAGVLPSADFNATLSAGYVLDDIGTNVNHGDLTHSLQWYAIMRDYDAHPGDYRFTPIELYTMIGDYDAQRRASRRFGFERPSLALWGETFDTSDANALLPDLAHPDGVRDLIRTEKRLERLSKELDRRYEERRGYGEKLFTIWQPIRGDDASVAAALPDIDAAANAEANSQYADIELYQKNAHLHPAGTAEKARILLADFLYQQRVYGVARRAGYAAVTVPDGSGGQRPLPILAPGGRVLETGRTDDAFQAGLLAERNRREQALVAAQPAPSAPAADDDDDFDLAPIHDDDDVASLAEDAEPESRQTEAPQAQNDDDDDELPADDRSASDSLAAGDISLPDPPDEEPEPVLSAGDSPPPPGESPGDRALRPGEAEGDRPEERNARRPERTSRAERQPALEEAN